MPKKSAKDRRAIAKKRTRLAEEKKHPFHQPLTEQEVKDAAAKMQAREKDEVGWVSPHLPGIRPYFRRVFSNERYPYYGLQGPDCIYFRKKLSKRRRKALGLKKKGDLPNERALIIEHWL